MKRELNRLNKGLLTYILGQALLSNPDEIDYLFIWWLLSLTTHEIDKTVSKVEEEMKAESESDFDLNKKYIKNNLEELGIDADLDFLTYDSVKSPRLNELIKHNYDKSKRGIENIVKSAKSIDDIQNYLSTLVKKNKQANSITSNLMRVFRTERTRMSSRMWLKTKEELSKRGIYVKVMWIHTLSNPSIMVGSNYHPRDDHMELNGTVEDSNGEFQLSSGVTTKGPGVSGIPSEDINCRCTLAFIVED